MTTTTSRRDFLKRAGGAGAGLFVAFHLPSCAASRRWGKEGELVANAAVRVTPDDRVIFTLARTEMGQGTMTSEAMFIAEELNLDPQDLEIELAPVHEDFNNPALGFQYTGGSSSTKHSFFTLRKAGAMTREALLGAAAVDWGVSRSELSIEGKEIRHGPSGRTVRIGAVATAARDHIDGDAEPKPASEWRVIGRRQTRLDIRPKVDGSAGYGADVRLPDMRVAVLLRPPMGGRLVSFDAAKAKTMTGVDDVVETPSGVAVVADTYWNAHRAAKTIEVEWSEGTAGTSDLWERYGKLLDEDDTSGVRSDGDIEEALAAADRTVEAEYRVPFVAHATMEPQNATAWVHDGKVELWAPTQIQGLAQKTAAEAAEASRDDVELHQLLLGGGFGRRLESDFITEAVHLSKVMKRPIKVMWSREDDIRHDFYRPANLHRLRGAVKGGRPTGWHHRFALQSVMRQTLKSWAGEIYGSAMSGMMAWAFFATQDDEPAIEGTKEIPYAIDAYDVRYAEAPPEIPVTFWRSVGHSHNAFVVESFFDELAHAAGRDPVELRLELLADHPQHRKVLELCAGKAGWTRTLPKGRARGVAVHESFESFAAQVAEVSVEGGNIRVHKVTCAIDCGRAIHPDGVVAQVESSIIFGLSAALKREAISVEKGRVQESNFHDFELLRMHETPEIDVHIVPRDDPPRGVGEPGLPPIAPAVANAVFALTGTRLRELPLRLPDV